MNHGWYTHIYLFTVALNLLCYISFKLFKRSSLNGYYLVDIGVLLYTDETKLFAVACRLSHVFSVKF